MSLPLKLYNSLTRSKELFGPIDRLAVRMYVCGPTVYDFAHIGNARPAIVFDVLFRLLRHGYGDDHVIYARNITDVDDKINARAQRDHPGKALNEAIALVTEGTERQFHEDVAALGCLPPTHEPRATAHITQMSELIERLVARGVAYVAQDNVLFSPSAMDALPGAPRYGSLARRSLDEMLAGARVDVAPYKRDAMDFVLWKPSKPGEPGWESPCGISVLGRPGWHIECSAMSMATLLRPFGGGLLCDDPAKNVFDIHGGGIDLVFPHHENEIAQSCCAFDGERMANVWMHNGFLQVEGEKMSKSRGNFITISELLTGWRGEPWAGVVVRYAMLSTHYRQPIDWTADRLSEAKANVYAAASYSNEASFRDATAFVRAWRDKPQPSQKVLAALSDDLNSPEALSEIGAAISRINSLSDSERIELVHNLRFLGVLDERKRRLLTGRIDISNSNIGKLPTNLVNEAALSIRNYRIAEANADVKSSALAVQWLTSHGFREADGGEFVYETEHSESSSIQALVELRQAARRRNDWLESDRIRDELLAVGVVLKDSKNGTTWELRR